jgi:hypothetical protein
MFRKHFRLRRKLFVGLAFAALAAPGSAQAVTGVFVDGGPVPVSTATSAPIQVRSEHSYVAPNQLQYVAPKQLQVEALRWQAMANAYLAPTQAISEAISERSFGVPGPDPSLVPQVISSSTSTGFDWRDAGIGASSGLGLALLLVLGVALMRRQQGAGLINT